MYSETELFEKKPISRVITSIILLLYVIATIYSNIAIINVHKQINKNEMAKASEIGEFIDTYEKENNIQVKKIAKHIFPYYTRNKFNNFVTIDAAKCLWSVTGCINFYNNLHLEEVDGTSEQRKMLEESNKEYICIDDILVVKIFYY